MRRGLRIGREGWGTRAHAGVWVQTSLIDRSIDRPTDRPTDLPTDLQGKGGLDLRQAKDEPLYETDLIRSSLSSAPWIFHLLYFTHVYRHFYIWLFTPLRFLSILP